MVQYCQVHEFQYLGVIAYFLRFYLWLFQNNVLELWSLFDFLMPGFLGTEKQFAAKYAKPIIQSRDAKSSSKEQEAGKKEIVYVWDIIMKWVNVLKREGNVVDMIQGGSIKPLLRFGGRLFRIGIRFENISKMIVIYVIFTVYGENSITNSACVAEISTFSWIT